MKLSDLINEWSSGDPSVVDDVRIGDENEKLAISTSLGQTEGKPPPAKTFTTKGRGKNYKKARAITRLARKAAEEGNSISADTPAQHGQNFDTNNIRR